MMTALFDRMLALYPDRLNPGPPWYGALAILSWGREKPCQRTKLKI